MEDLALIVTIIMSVLLLSGPINIGLTSERAQLYTEDRRVLRILRRVIALTIGIIGIFIANPIFI
jgi:threonine/homoserine/homoserine lactone efflux protein